MVYFTKYVWHLPWRKRSKFRQRDKGAMKRAEESSGPPFSALQRNTRREGGRWNFCSFPLYQQKADLLGLRSHTEFLSLRTTSRIPISSIGTSPPTLGQHFPSKERQFPLGDCITDSLSHRDGTRKNMKRSIPSLCHLHRFLKPKTAQGTGPWEQAC